MSRLSDSQKERLARIVGLPLVRVFLALAVKIMVARHRAGVTLVCFNQEDHVLLLRHVFHPSAPWDLPGGWLERDESPAECALRELWEETGLRAKLGPVVRLTREKTPSHLGITYVGRLNGSMPRPVLSGEILEARWFEPDALPQRLRPATRLAVESAVRHLPMWQPMEQQLNV
ncbi:MAG: NUDIX hydrolase [Chloroflexota bacterium]